MFHLDQLRDLLYVEREYHRTRYRLVYGHLRGNIFARLFLLIILEKDNTARSVGQPVGRSVGQPIRHVVLAQGGSGSDGIVRGTVRARCPYRYLSLVYDRPDPVRSAIIRDSDCCR